MDEKKIREKLAGYAEFQRVHEQRLQQHFGGDFRWLVLRMDPYCPCKLFRQLNGLSLRVDHKFWNDFYPPFCWGCRCKVRGARTENGARRIGARDELFLTKGWREQLTQQVDPAFMGSQAPTLNEYRTHLNALYGRVGPS